MPTPIDLAAVRADTPGCTQVLHLNNAGASLQPASVIEAHIAHLNREGEIGGYEAADEARSMTQATYASVARLLHADPSEIALVDHATRAWETAFWSMDWAEGDRIITDRVSYASSYLSMLRAKETRGVRIMVAPSDGSGQVDVDGLEALATDDVKLIALTHVPTNGGLINPAAAVGSVARRHGIPYLLDACQSAGQMPLDVDEIGCDMLSATGRKYLRGPRGTGFLYVRNSMINRLNPPSPDLLAAQWTEPDRYELRPDARRFETWEHAVAARIALGVATDYAMNVGLDAIRERIDRLAESLRLALKEIPGIVVHDIGSEKSGIVTFSHGDTPSRAIRQALLALRINTSLSVPASTLLDARARDLPETVRASVHYYNSEDELERFVSELRLILGHPRV